MRIESATYISRNEFGEEEVEILFELNWFDKLLRRPPIKRFVRPAMRGWVEKDSGRALSVGEAMMVAQVIDASSQFTDL